jgi:hypothetical protein
MSVDPLAPLEGEGLTAYLQRTRPQYDWNDDGGNAEPTAQTDLNDGYQNFTVVLRARVSRAEWAAYVGTVYPAPIAVDVNVPPVWPGLDLVTLGTPVALVDGLVVDGPLDGVLVDVTTAPTRVGQRVIGGQYFDYNSGEMTFGSDNGYLEPWVYTGFRLAIFTPKTMKQAAHAYFRVLAGAAGTVTPWTKTV